MKSLKDILSESKDEMSDSGESMDSEESGNLASDLFTALKEGDEEALVDIIKLVMDKCKGKSEDESESKGSALLIGLGKK